MAAYPRIRLHLPLRPEPVCSWPALRSSRHPPTPKPSPRYGAKESAECGGAMNHRVIGLGLGLGLGACATRAAPPSPARVGVVPVALSSVAPAPAQPAAKDGSTTQSHEGRRIKRMLVRVEAARGLSSSRVVPGVALPRSELIARVRA